MAESDAARLSVDLIDVDEGRDGEFRDLARQLVDVIGRQQYGQAEVIQDDAVPRRSYLVRRWRTAAAGRGAQSDPELHAIASALHKVGHVTTVVAGVGDAARPSEPLTGPARAFVVDRRTSGDRRVKNVGRPEGDRRVSDRRLGQDPPRRPPVDLVDAARRAREHAAAAFSHFRVGAAIQTVDGTIVTGCNVENATYGLTICAERVAMFKAISEGHRTFRRVAVVADTEAPTPPCGACRQILWEFGGDLEVVLANLVEEKGRYRLKDLLPLPFDARLL